jgi:hypothetical protein
VVVSTLSDALREFLERHPGEAFTARELWEQVDWPGRVFPSHVQQALERRLFLEGAVAADDVRLEGDWAKASPETRWCAWEGAPAGFLVYEPGVGIRRRWPWEETWR